MKRLIFDEKLRVFCSRPLSPEREEQIYMAIEDKLSDLKLDLQNDFPELEVT